MVFNPCCATITNTIMCYVWYPTQRMCARRYFVRLHIALCYCCAWCMLTAGIAATSLDPYVSEDEWRELVRLLTIATACLIVRSSSLGLRCHRTRRCLKHEACLFESTTLLHPSSFCFLLLAFLLLIQKHNHANLIG